MTPNRKRASANPRGGLFLSWLRNVQPTVNKRTIRLLAAVMLLLPAGQLGAQDTQYWTNQYGNRARMLGGSVIGSISDISAVYYNPGRLALNTTTGLILAGNVFQATSVTREAPLASERDLESTKIDALPALFAGEFTLGFLGRSRLAYSLLMLGFPSARNILANPKASEF